MTRRHYQSAKLNRFERRKLIRRSRRYRFLRWWPRVGPRVDAVSGWIRMWALLTLGAYFWLVLAMGPGSGLLPWPWDEIVCTLGGAALLVWQVWSMISADVKKGGKPRR